MPRRGKKNVGVIGLGIIGSRVVQNLRSKGFHVFVWNRSPRPVPNFVGSPPEVAEMCDSVQIFVSDDDALLEVAKQLSPALAPRHIVMAHCTVSPHSMQAAAEIVERRGARFIEAPFTGSKSAAEKGELIYYISGDEMALRDARPILEATSTRVVEIGRIGQATAIKVATNILTAAIVQAAAEALALVESSGLPPNKLAEALEANASNSKTLQMKLPKMIQRDFEPHFSIKHMLKDMQIANRMGLLNHLELSVTGAIRDRLLEQMQRGYGDDDFSAVARKYLPETKPKTEETTILELFNATAPVEPAFAPMPAAEQPTSAGPHEAISPRADAQQEEKPLAAGPPPSEPRVEAPASEPLKEPSLLRNEEAPASEAMTNAASAPEEPAEERTRRGLFGRLLRRGGEY